MFFRDRSVMQRIQGSFTIHLSSQNTLPDPQKIAGPVKMCSICGKKAGPDSTVLSLHARMTLKEIDR